MNRINEGFTEATKQLVWEKAHPVAGYDPNYIRKDNCGAWIARSDHGNTNSEYGWEVDHIKPISKGGTDMLSNLQPLQWENNRYKGDNYPNWWCKVKAA